MKFIFSLFVVICLLLSSCGKTPFACFQIVTPVDSIRVGKKIEFNAACSSDALDYFWDFGNGLGGENQTASVVYDSTGTYNVSLLITNGRKSGNTQKSIVVKP